MDEDKKEALRKLLKGEPAEEVKPKGSIKRTVSSTGFEDFDQQQLLYRLDHATTADVRSRVQIELGKRFDRKYRLTLAHIIEIGDVAAELLGYKSASAPVSEPEPEPVDPEVPYEPGSDPEETIEYRDLDSGYSISLTKDEMKKVSDDRYLSAAEQYNRTEPEPELTPPLSADIIKEIRTSQRPYGPYLREISQSAWDYIDRRDIKKPMWRSSDYAYGYVQTHKNDTDMANRLVSEEQFGFLMIILGAYLHWKTAPKLVSNNR